MEPGNNIPSPLVWAKKSYSVEDFCIVFIVVLHIYYMCASQLAFVMIGETRNEYGIYIVLMYN